MVTAQTAKAEQTAWLNLKEHTRGDVCHTCAVAYSKPLTDAEVMEAMCPGGRNIRQAWLDAFAANGHRSGN